MRIVIPFLLFFLTYLPAFSQEVHNASYYFEKGEAAFDKQQYRTAIAHFNECLRLEPYFIEAYYARARTRERIGDKQGALTDYNIYLESKPDNAEALFSRAVSRYEFGQWAIAKEDFTKLLTMPAGETNTVYFEVDPAGETGKAITAQGGLTPAIINYLGLIELNLKNYGRAIARFDSALSIKPNEPDYLLNRGLARQQSGDTVSAINDYKRVLSVNPNNNLARHNLAVLGASGSNPQETERQLTEAINENPKLPYSYAERGALRLKTGNLKGALTDYSEAIKLDPNNPDYWLNRGIAKEKGNDLNGALADYKQTITLKSNYEKGWMNHGNVLVKLNRLNEAIDDYSVAITHYPDYALAFYNRALAKHKAGKKKEACLDLEQARKLGTRIDAKVTAALCQ